MGLTLEQKLDCLNDDETDAIEAIVDLLLYNRRDRKSGYASAKPKTKAMERK